MPSHRPKKFLVVEPLTRQEGAIIDYLKLRGIEHAELLTPYAALGRVVARGHVDVQDGRARLSLGGQVVAGQRAAGTGWSDAPARVPRRDRGATTGPTRWAYVMIRDVQGPRPGRWRYMSELDALRPTADRRHALRYAPHVAELDVAELVEENRGRFEFKIVRAPAPAAQRPRRSSRAR